jgi:hypothetical protein
MDVETCFPGLLGLAQRCSHMERLNTLPAVHLV